MAIKRCNGCSRDLPLDFFAKGRHQRDGLQTQCRLCQKIAKAAWGQRNKEKERERQRREYAADPQRYLARKKAWRDANPEKTKEILARYKERHPGATNNSAAEWAKRNPEKRREMTRNYYRNNSERMAKWTRDYRNASPARVLHCRISAQIRGCLKGLKAGKSAFKILGYSREALAHHLERQFVKGMNWENYGEWHIDHIIPLSSFDISSPDDASLKEAWALTNLRPLWATENYSKRDRRTHLL